MRMSRALPIGVGGLVLIGALSLLTGQNFFQLLLPMLNQPQVSMTDTGAPVDASPEAVWRVGLGKLCDVAARYETPERQLGRKFRERVGVVLAELDRLQENLRGGRDDFMTGFWAGYCLQGYDRPPRPRAAAAEAKGGAQ